ncbi:fimbrial biogenesis chaperone [Aeromonas salmonicida]|uniref:fimbrial biogenesis chaperone n=1 Tax=Aeromonas salmonicida TaxID=645 RepID=UPI003D241E34
MPFIHVRYAALTCLICGYAHAAISLSDARLIYDGTQEAAFIHVYNSGETAVAIRAWLAKDQDCIYPPPFSLAPTQARLKKGERLLLQVSKPGVGLPHDRESVFWLNVQARPHLTPGANSSPWAPPIRVRLLYRPPGLWQNPAMAPELLAVKLRNGKINLYNPTPYHLHMLAFNQHALEGGGEWLYPGRKLSISAPAGMTPSGPFSVDLVNDEGIAITYQGVLHKGVASGLLPTSFYPG